MYMAHGLFQCVTIILVKFKIQLQLYTTWPRMIYGEMEGSQRSHVWNHFTEQCDVLVLRVIYVRLF